MFIDPWLILPAIVAGAALTGLVVLQRAVRRALRRRLGLGPTLRGRRA